ncbi:MAG: hypothetical protein WCK77_17140 [Verrucomicrobiota bacterium]
MGYRFMTPRFSLGRIVATSGAVALNVDLEALLRRHHYGDWGDLDDDDRQANEAALIHGDRILSHYRLAGGVRIYIITEHDRSSTCIMLREEY